LGNFGYLDKFSKFNHGVVGFRSRPNKQARYPAGPAAMHTNKAMTEIVPTKQGKTGLENRISNPNNKEVSILLMKNNSWLILSIVFAAAAIAIHTGHAEVPPPPRSLQVGPTESPLVAPGDKRFLTLEGAAAHAHRGDVIEVLPGHYLPSSTISKDGVSYSFPANSTIVYTNETLAPLIGDGVFTISGHGRFIANGAVPQNSLIDVRDPASDIVIEARELSRTNQGPPDFFVVQQTEGRVSIRANKIFNRSGAAPLYWEGGEFHTFAETLESSLTPAIYSICQLTNDWYHNGDLVRGWIIYQDSGNGPEAGVWIRIAKGIATGPYHGVLNTGGKLYIDAQKLSAQSLEADRALFETTGGKAWARVMKTTSNQRHLAVSGGLNLLTIDHMEDVNDKTTEIIFFNGGETYLRGQLYRGGTNSSGVHFTGGTAVMQDMVLDTSASVNSSNRSPVVVEGPGLVLKNVTLVAPPNTPSVKAVGPQTVVIDGTLKVNTAPDPQVELTGGILQWNNTNFFPGVIRAQGNIAPYRFDTHLLSLNTAYTNLSNQRATIYLSVALATSAKHGAAVELRAVQSDGTLDINPLASGPGITATNVMQVSTKLDPGATFILTNLGPGTASIVRSKIVYE
jgi:hypothetical protein